LTWLFCVIARSLNNRF